MGQEINSYRFEKHHFEDFEARLRRETDLLSSWFEDSAFADDGLVGGFELEAWLIDRQGLPAPINTEFLARVKNDLVVPELARFNVEINGLPHALRDRALKDMERELDATIAECTRAAGELDARLVMIGILPTVEDHLLSLDYMSDRRRYRALNEQILRMRGGRPLRLSISGREHLEVTHRDVMLEAAATSLQLHLQVDQAQACRYYNASKIIAGPLTAVAANSPYLYGRDLWSETRIPLFEQAVDVRAGGELKRVTFGQGYVRESLMETFRINLDKYAVLLPIVDEDQPTDALAHLRLHNGTIWRWTRPLIGFDETGTRPHLRIEHRVASAGPSVKDTVANAAFFYGLAQSLANMEPPPESLLDFKTARANFYEAARKGLKAELVWFDGRRWEIRKLILHELLPLARKGLEAVSVAAQDIEYYTGIMEKRVLSSQNGAAWQRAFVAKHGADMQELTRVYVAQQESGAPVHEWDV